MISASKVFAGLLFGLLLALSAYAGPSCAETAYNDIASLEKAAAQGDAAAQFNLGVLYDQGRGVRQDYQKAREWWEKAAAQGHAMAQVKLGFLYYYGQGVRQDYQKAREWFEKAAAQGEATAQVGLGLLYENGHGVRQDLATAKEWYGIACNNGDQTGCDGYRRLNTMER